MKSMLDLEASLSARSVAYRELQQEKVRGWGSEAVEAYWRSSDSMFDARCDRVRSAECLLRCADLPACCGGVTPCPSAMPARAK